jgi:FKBP-type peptidyl-prolyl cis-trans isomerase FkpA
MKKLLYLFLVSLTIISCSEDEFNPENEQDIIAYLEDNNINATRTSSGLYYIIEEEGTGENPTSNSNVTVAYKGYLLNGTVFDESPSSGISFGLNQVIRGWTEGIPLFKEGGKGKLFIPPGLGYGNRAIGRIPPGSVLVFDIHLIAIN